MNVKNKSALSIFIRLQFLILAACLVSTACATRSRLVEHSFEFDARWDSPGIEILDYWYGTSNLPGLRGCPKQYAPCATSRQYAGTTGDIPLGDELTVKWRVKSTGNVYQDTVKLSDRLPENMKNQKIRFVIKDSQLYVFVISSEKSVPNPCLPRNQMCRITDPSCPSAYDRVFALYCNVKFTQIYPDQPTSLKLK